MDPVTILGAVGSVVGIAAFGLKIAVFLDQFISDYGEAGEILATVLDGIEATLEALKQIRELLQDEEKTIKDGKEPQLFTLKALKLIRKTSDKCLKIFWRIEGAISKKVPTDEEIKVKLEKFHLQVKDGKDEANLQLNKRLLKPLKPNRWDRWRFAFNLNEKLERYNRQLDRQQSTLILLFQVISLKINLTQPNSNTPYNIHLLFNQIPQTALHSGIPEVRKRRQSSYIYPPGAANPLSSRWHDEDSGYYHPPLHLAPARRNSRYRSRYNDPPQREPPPRRRSASVSPDRGRRHPNPNSRRRRHSLSGDEMDGIRIPEDKETKVESAASDDSEAERQRQAELQRELEREKLKVVEATLALDRKIGGRKDSDVVEYKTPEVVSGAKNGEPSSRPRFTHSPTRMEEEIESVLDSLMPQRGSFRGSVVPEKNDSGRPTPRRPVRYQKPSVSDQPVDTPIDEKEDVAEDLKAQPTVFDFDPTETILPSKKPLLGTQSTSNPGATSGADSHVKDFNISQTPNNGVRDQPVSVEAPPSTNAAKSPSVHSEKSDRSMSFEDLYSKREFQLGWKDNEAAKKASQIASSSILTEKPTSTLPTALEKDVETESRTRVPTEEPLSSLPKHTEDQEPPQITVDLSNGASETPLNETEKVKTPIMNDISDVNSITKSDYAYDWASPSKLNETREHDIVTATDPLIVSGEDQITAKLDLSSKDVIEGTAMPKIGSSSRIEEEFNPWSLKRGVSSHQKAATFSFDFDSNSKDKGKEKEIVASLPIFEPKLPTSTPYAQSGGQIIVSFDTPETEVHEISTKPVETVENVDDAENGNKKSNILNGLQSITTHQPIDQVDHGPWSHNKLPFWQHDDSGSKSQEILTFKNTGTDFSNITSNPRVSSQTRKSTAITDLLRNGFLPDPVTETVADSVINAWAFAVIAKRNRKKNERVGASTEPLREKPNEDSKVTTSPNSMALILYPDPAILKRMWEAPRLYQPTLEDGDNSTAHSVSDAESVPEPLEEIRSIHEEELEPSTFIPDNEIVSETLSYKYVPPLEETTSNAGRVSPSISDSKLARSSVDNNDDHIIDIENGETLGPIDDTMSGALPFVEESPSHHGTPPLIVEDTSNKTDVAAVVAGFGTWGTDWGTFPTKNRIKEKKTDVLNQEGKSGDGIEEATETPKTVIGDLDNADNVLVTEDDPWGFAPKKKKKKTDVLKRKEKSGDGIEEATETSKIATKDVGNADYVTVVEEPSDSDPWAFAPKKKKKKKKKKKANSWDEEPPVPEPPEPEPEPTSPIEEVIKLPEGVVVEDLDTAASKKKADRKNKFSLPPPIPRYPPLPPGTTIVDTSLSPISSVTRLHVDPKPWYKRASLKRSKYVTIDGVKYLDRRGLDSLASGSVTSSNVPKPSRFMKGVIRGSALVAGLLGVTEDRDQTGFISAFVIKDGEYHQIPHNGRFESDGFSKLKPSRGRDWWKEYAFLSPNDLAALKVILEENKDYEKNLVQLKHLQKAKFKFWSTNEEVLIAIVSNEIRRGYSSGSSSEQELPLDKSKLVEEEKDNHVSSAPKITEAEKPESKVETSNEPSYESQRSCLAYTIRVLFPHNTVGDVAGITCQREPFSEIDITDQIARLNANGGSIVQKKINLMAAQNEEIEKLLKSLVPKDRDVDYAWTLAQMEDHDGPGQRSTTVYLRRQFLSPKVVEEVEPVEAKLPTPAPKKETVPKPALAKSSSASIPKPSVKFEDQTPKKKATAEPKVPDQNNVRVKVTVNSATDSDYSNESDESWDPVHSDEIEPSDSASAVRPARRNTPRRRPVSKHPSPTPSVDNQYPGYGRGYPPPAQAPAGAPRPGYAQSAYSDPGMLPYGGAPGMQPYPGYAVPSGYPYSNGPYSLPPPGAGYFGGHHPMPAPGTPGGYPMPTNSNPFLPQPIYPQGSYYPGYGYMGAAASSQHHIPPPVQHPGFQFGMENKPSTRSHNPFGPPNTGSYPASRRYAENDTPRPNARSYSERYDDEYPDVPEAPYIDRRRAAPPHPPPAPEPDREGDRPPLSRRKSSLDTFDRKSMPTQPPMDRSLRLQSREVTRPSFLNEPVGTTLRTEYDERRKPPSPQPLVSYGRPGMNARRDTMYEDLYGEESGPSHVPAYESTMALQGRPAISTRTPNGGDRSAYASARRSHYSDYAEPAIPLTRPHMPYPEHYDAKSFDPLVINDEEEKNDIVQKLLKEWTPDVNKEDGDVKGKGKERKEVDESGEKVKENKKEDEDEEETSDSDSDDDWSEINGYGGVKLTDISARPQSQYASRATPTRTYGDERDYYSRLQSERTAAGDTYTSATKDWATVDVPPGDAYSSTRHRELMAPVRRQSYSSRPYVPLGNPYASAPSMSYRYPPPPPPPSFPIKIPRQPGVERPIATIPRPHQPGTRAFQRDEEGKVVETALSKSKAPAPLPSRSPKQKDEPKPPAASDTSTITIDSSKRRTGSHERISLPPVTRVVERERERERNGSPSPKRETVRTRVLERPPPPIPRERERVRSFSPDISLDEYEPTRIPIKPLHAAVREGSLSPPRRTYSSSEEEITPSVAPPRTREGERIPPAAIRTRERVRSFSPDISLDEYEPMRNPIKPLNATVGEEIPSGPRVYTREMEDHASSVPGSSMRSWSDSFSLLRDHAKRQRTPSPPDRVRGMNATVTDVPQSYEERRERRGQQRQNSTYAGKLREADEYAMGMRTGEHVETEDMDINITRMRSGGTEVNITRKRPEYVVPGYGNLDVDIGRTRPREYGETTTADVTQTKLEELERNAYENTMRGLEATLRFAREKGDMTTVNSLEEQKINLASQENGRRRKHDIEKQRKDMRARETAAGSGRAGTTVQAEILGMGRVPIRPATTNKPQMINQDLWTKVTKDQVCREAIDEFGYEFKETEVFFYIMQHLPYEDVLELVQRSQTIKEEKLLIAEIERERRREMAAAPDYRQRRGGSEPPDRWDAERFNTGGEREYVERSRRDVSRIRSGYPRPPPPMPVPPPTHRIASGIYYGERRTQQDEIDRRAKMQRPREPENRYEDRDAFRSQLRDLRARNEEISSRRTPEPRMPGQRREDYL